MAKALASYLLASVTYWQSGECLYFSRVHTQMNCWLLRLLTAIRVNSYLRCRRVAYVSVSFFLLACQLHSTVSQIAEWRLYDKVTILPIVQVFSLQ